MSVIFVLFVESRRLEHLFIDVHGFGGLVKRDRPGTFILIAFTFLIIHIDKGLRVEISVVVDERVEI